MSCRLARRMGPARQLWHPVSAIAVVVRSYVSSRKVYPCLRKSSALADNMETFRFGCDGLHDWDVWSDGVCPPTLRPPIRIQRFHALCYASTCGLSDSAFRMSSRWCRRLGSVVSCGLHVLSFRRRCMHMPRCGFGGVASLVLTPG